MPNGPPPSEAAQDNALSQGAGEDTPFLCDGSDRPPRGAADKGGVADLETIDSYEHADGVGSNGNPEAPAEDAGEPSEEPEEDTALDDPRAQMTFWDHLEELRGTLIKCLLVLFVGVCLVGLFFSQANELILWPLNQAIEGRPDRAEFLRMNTMFGVFSVIVEIALLGGFLLSLPLIVYFVSRFVAPGLTAKEKRILVPCCLSAVGLFLFGVLFSYFVLLPAGISVSLSINEGMGFYLQPNVQDYYNLVAWMLGGVGLVFEFPLLLLVLVYLEIITPQMLTKYRRHVLVLIFIVAAVATPPDVVSQILMAVPLYILYELTILVGKWLLKRKHAAA